MARRRRKCFLVMALALWAWAFSGLASAQFWTRIDVDNPEREGIFGHRIEIIGDLMLVSWRGDDTIGRYSGAIMVYEVTDQGIQFRERVIGSKVEPGDQFGNDFIVSGNELLVEEDQGSDVYNFRYDGAGLVEVAALPMPELPGYIYRTLTMALDGDWAFVSVRVQTAAYPRNYYGSTVFVFKRTGDNWEYHSRIDPPSFPEGHPWFGVELAISGTHAAIFDASDAGSPGSGLGAITFELVNDIWEWGSPLSPGGSDIEFTSDQEIRARAGNTTHWYRRVDEMWVADRQMQFVSDDVWARRWVSLNELEDALFLMRGIPDATLDWIYEVDVFKRGAGNTEWIYDSTFQSPAPAKTGDGFGREIALTNTFLMVGAPDRDLDLRPEGGEFLDEVGAVYVARREYFVPTDVDSDLFEVPTEAAVILAYPNPSNGHVTIEYWLQRPGPITISVHDVLGRLVGRSKFKTRHPGSYSHRLDLSSNPPGVYFYSLTSGDFSQTRKMVVVK